MTVPSMTPTERMMMKGLLRPRLEPQRSDSEPMTGVRKKPISGERHQIIVMCSWRTPASNGKSSQFFTVPFKGDLAPTLFAIVNRVVGVVMDYLLLSIHLEIPMSPLGSRTATVTAHQTQNISLCCQKKIVHDHRDHSVLTRQNLKTIN